MLKNITKRDVKIFFLGILAMLLIEVVFNWDGTVGDFMRGVKGGYNSVR